MPRDNQTTLRGNLTEDPELRFTQSGVAVCKLRVAVNAYRGKDKEDATTFWNVSVWRDQGEHVAESLNKGDRVIVVGELTQRSYENKEGQTVWVTEVEADEVAPSLMWRTVTLERTSRNATPAPAKETADVPF